MFGNVLQKIERAAFRQAVRKGGLCCPECGAPVSKPDVEAGDHLACAECGQSSAAREWVRSGGPPRGWPDRPPQGTGILREIHPDGAVRWNIPASGRSGGFLWFGVIWCVITAVVSGGILFAVLFGTPGKDADTIPGWLLALILCGFFGIFWAVGLGMLYVAARNKWGKVRVTITSDEVVLARRLFGRTGSKRVPRSEVTDVRAEEFYRSNETPVYGVIISAGKRNLKFGSVLRDDEKGWLAADLKRTLFGETPRKRRVTADVPMASRVPGDRPFSEVLPAARRHLMPIAILLTIIGVGFLTVGVFVIEGPDRSDVPDKTFRIIEGIFGFLIGGFRTLWILMSTAMTGIGVALWVRILRDRHVERRIEGDASMIAIRRYRRGLILSEESYPRGEVTGFDASSSGHSNGRPMKRIELRIGSDTKTLAYWIDAAAADEVVGRVSAALWRG